MKNEPRVVGTDSVHAARFALVCVALGALWWALLLVPALSRSVIALSGLGLSFFVVQGAVLGACYSFRCVYRHAARAIPWLAGTLVALYASTTAVVSIWPSVEEHGAAFYALSLALANAWYVVIPMAGFSGLLVTELE